MLLVDSAPVLMTCDCVLLMKLSAVGAAEVTACPVMMFAADYVVLMVCVTLFLICLDTSRSPSLRLVTAQV